MSNLYQMMCQTGSLPAPKRREIGRPPSARWSDDDPGPVLSSPGAGGSNRAPHRMPLHEESPVSTVADACDVSSKDDDAGGCSNGVLRLTSPGAFEQRYGLQIADCDDEISMISDPIVMLPGHDSSGNAPKKGQRLPLIESEATQSVTSSEDSCFETPECETVRRRVMDDLSIYTDQADFVFEDDSTEVSPEFAQYFPRSMDLLASDSFDVMAHASFDDCDTVCDSTLVEVEAFKGDLWTEMHSKSHSPVATSESRKQTKYNRYRHLQAPHKKEQAAPHPFEHFTDISGEAKTKSIYEKLDEKVQQLLMGNRDDFETLQYHLDVMKFSTSGISSKKYPSLRTESIDYIDPIESSTSQPLFTKRCPTLDEVRRQEAKNLASLSKARPSSYVYSRKIEAD